MERLSCEKGRQQRQKKGREIEKENKEVDEQIDSLLFYLDLKTFIRKFKKSVIIKMKLLFWFQIS